MAQNIANFGTMVNLNDYEMEWNEYAQVGSKLQEEFRGLKFDDPYKLTDVSFCV